MSEEFQHKPVLLNEAIDNLLIDSDGIYIDATFGRGGHSLYLLERLSAKGKLLVIDKDLQAISCAKKINDSRLIVRHGSFAGLGDFVDSLGLCGKVSGILLDLGVSSPQLDDASRGFSFSHDGPLDMRMNTDQHLTAGEWLHHASEEEIASVLRDYGEERFGKRIARAIILERKLSKITTTGRLAEIVKAAHPRWERHKHPATRTFQALRIKVNDELYELEECLREALDALTIFGRLLVISFHSLESRIVRKFIRENDGSHAFPLKLPVVSDEIRMRIRKINQIRPSAYEIAENPRARSANLIVMEKMA